MRFLTNTFNFDNVLKGYIDDYFNNYKEAITDSTNKQFKEFDLKGESCRALKIDVYYKVLYLMINLYGEVKSNIAYINDDTLHWETFSYKYNLKEVNKCLSCFGINIIDALNLFHIKDFFNGASDKFYGIDYLGVEVNFSPI